MKRPGFLNIAADIGLVVGLIAALGFVFLFDRLANVDTPAESSSLLEVVEVATSAARPPRKLRLSVTPQPAQFDDVGSLLDTLGDGYTYRPLPLEQLTEATALAEIDVLFITCSGVPRSWLDQPTGDSSARGLTQYSPNKAVFEKLKTNLREYVRRGGVIYASDLQFLQISDCFSEFVDTEQVAPGARQKVTAEVVDAGLRELLGSTIELNFDQKGWYPAAFLREKSGVFLQGEFETLEGDRKTAPLLVKFSFGDGAVIFTSFHNEKQNSAKEIALLRYLVFTAVTAESEAKATQMMVKGGFSPAKRNLFSTSATEQSAAQTYHCSKRGPLQFVLGFPNQGARLKLTVTSPSGKTAEKSGDSTFNVEIADAEVGDWKYAVTAIQIPNDNFPYTVTVGQK